MMAAENPSSSANKLAKVTEAFKSFKIAVDENLDKLEKAFLVEVDRTCDSVNVLVNKVKDVKDEKLGATVKDEFKNVDVNYPDEILNQAWAVIRNNIAWLVSGGTVVYYYHYLPKDNKYNFFKCIMNEDDNIIRVPSTIIMLICFLNRSNWDNLLLLCTFLYE